MKITPFSIQIKVILSVFWMFNQICAEHLEILNAGKFRYFHLCVFFVSFYLKIKQESSVFFSNLYLFFILVQGMLYLM